MAVSVYLKNVCSAVGEGPHWQPSTQSFFFIDHINGTFYRHNSTTKKLSSVKIDEAVGFIIPRKSGGFIASAEKKLVALDWETEKLTTLAELDQDKPTRINDAKCDAEGRLWTGTFNAETDPHKTVPNLGSLYSMDTSYVVRHHMDSVTISNGITWSPDNSTMYYVDSVPRKLYAFDFDLSQGTISNHRVLKDFSALPIQEVGYPDGICMDQEGKVWVACFGSACVVRLDGETGEILQKVDIPAKCTTSCCFGGNDLSELFVTSSAAANHMSEKDFEKWPLAGSVFKVTGLGVKGMPVFEYGG